MSEFDYGSGQEGLNYPNPYRFENRFLMIRMGLFGASALGLLYFAKLALDEKLLWGVAIYLVGAVAFVLTLLKDSYKLTQQLKVYFGRNEPKSLAPNLPEGQKGSSNLGQKLRENVRSGALSLKIPPGYLNGILYTYLKTLIIAPQSLQIKMQQVFANLVRLTMLVVLFMMAWFMAQGSSAQQWLSVFFFGVTFLLILWPLSRKGDEHSAVSLNVSTFWQLLVLCLAAPIGVVVFGDRLPVLPEQLYLGSQAFGLLGLMSFGELLCFLALMSQLEPATPISGAGVQRSVSFNAAPSQISLEIERRLQEEWVEKIPNRIYINQPAPLEQKDAGMFEGILLQETHPLPPKFLRQKKSLWDLMGVERYRRLVYLNVGALIASGAGAAIVLYLCWGLQDQNADHWWAMGWGSFAMALLALGSYWMKVAHPLWGRFDFSSLVYLVEYEGNYVRALMNFGNAVRDRVQTSKQIVTVDEMSLRVWVTYVQSVVFEHGLGHHRVYEREAQKSKLQEAMERKKEKGKKITRKEQLALESLMGQMDQNTRTVVRLYGLEEDAQQLADHIEAFAQRQSVILSPTSPQDLEKMAGLARVDQELSNKFNGAGQGSSGHRGVVLGLDYIDQEESPEEKKGKGSTWAEGWD